MLGLVVADDGHVDAGPFLAHQAELLFKYCWPESHVTASGQSESAMLPHQTNQARDNLL
ncbi:hypothetical protein J6590_063186 [Homalodisca vitripennis]|nr:hypothetical protein J6590_063186 [Homalodisca vitripennis]